MICFFKENRAIPEPYQLGSPKKVAEAILNFIYIRTLQEAK
jgi:hypothetical protein